MFQNHFYTSDRWCTTATAIADRRALRYSMTKRRPRPLRSAGAPRALLPRFSRALLPQLGIPMKTPVVHMKKLGILVNKQGNPAKKLGASCETAVGSYEQARKVYRTC